MTQEALKPQLNIPVVMGSVLIENGNYSVGDNYDDVEIKEVHNLELLINHLGVITWYLHNSKQPHHIYWMNGEIREVKEYHFCSTAYYPNTKFIDWGKYLHKTLQYRIAEDLGFDSPKEMANYLIEKYKNGFSGQIISFREVSY